MYGCALWKFEQWPVGSDDFSKVLKPDQTGTYFDALPEWIWQKIVTNISHCKKISCHLLIYHQYIIQGYFKLTCRICSNCFDQSLMYEEIPKQSGVVHSCEWLAAVSWSFYQAPSTNHQLVIVMPTSSQYEAFLSHQIPTNQNNNERRRNHQTRINKDSYHHPR